MSDQPTPPPNEQRAWTPTGDPCPRCGAPLKARATADVSSLHFVQCQSCTWGLDVGRILKMLRRQDEALSTTDVEPTSPETKP